MSTTIYTPIRPTHEGAPPETPDTPGPSEPMPRDMDDDALRREIHRLEQEEADRIRYNEPATAESRSDAARLYELDSERQDRLHGRLGFGPYASRGTNDIPTGRTPRTAEVGGDGWPQDPPGGFVYHIVITDAFAASLETAEHDHEMPEAA